MYVLNIKFGIFIVFVLCMSCGTVIIFVNITDYRVSVLNTIIISYPLLTYQPNHVYSMKPFVLLCFVFYSSIIDDIHSRLIWKMKQYFESKEQTHS
jgi:hypothetical protein